MKQHKLNPKCIPSALYLNNSCDIKIAEVIVTNFISLLSLLNPPYFTTESKMMSLSCFCNPHSCFYKFACFWASYHSEYVCIFIFIGLKKIYASCALDTPGSIKQKAIALIFALNARRKQQAMEQAKTGWLWINIVDRHVYRCLALQWSCIIKKTTLNVDLVHSVYDLIIVSSAYAVTSIKQSPVFKGLHFFILS